MERTLQEHDDRRRRQLRRRVAQQLRRPRSGPLLPHERARHADAARGRAPHRPRAASTTSRPARSTATSRSTAPTPSARSRRTRRARRTTRRRRRPTTPSAPTPRRIGLPVTITNCSNNYGPRQFPEKVIPLFLTNALDDVPLPLYSSTQNRREWLHVDDHCRAIELVLERGRVGDTYNVGSGIEASIEEIADRILELTGSPPSSRRSSPTVPDTTGATCSTRRSCGPSSAGRQQVEFDEGLAVTVDWYADNRDWWEPLKERAPVVETAWS